MPKYATTITQQISLLQSRGLTILNQVKAQEILLDVSYYRMGFYLFPFEQSYPKLNNRTHQYINGATFEDAVNLYYFDFDLRMTLMRYLNRIEIAFRTAMIYHLSNKYRNDPVWFINPNVVNSSYAQAFGPTIYTADFKRNPVITRHHKMYPNDRFAPAWKTLEFMTFGAVLKLYDELKDNNDRIMIAQLFGVRQVVTFHSYMHTILNVRNACAHGSLLYDLRLTRAIRKGPAQNKSYERNNIIGALRVIKYVMGQISKNRSTDLSKAVNNLYQGLCSTSPILTKLIPNFSSI